MRSGERGPAARDPTGRFGDRVEHYARHRPGYPGAVLDLVEREAGLAPGAAVADVGSGTGILSAQLLDRGWEVWAVEPNRKMRAEAERRLGGRPGFHSVAGSAEATGLPARSVDCVTAAQAFHWFDREAAREEFLRILRPRAARDDGAADDPPEAREEGRKREDGEPGGRVFLLWNTRRTDGSPFLREFEMFLRTHGTDLQAVRHDRIPEEEFRRFFGGACRRAVFPNEQVLDRDGLRGRVLSMSFVPGKGDPGRGAMIEALDRLFTRHAEGGRVRLEYDTQVWYGRLASR